jgi:hypothetical protein
VIVGVAVRFAYSLGLHVQNDDISTVEGSKESLTRTWWSLYFLEQTLSIITGRPSMIIDLCCSISLSMPFPEGLANDAEASMRHRQDSKACRSTKSTSQLPFDNSLDPLHTSTNANVTEANSGSYFNATVQLAMITERILTSLYSASSTMQTPEELQQNIHQVARRLDQWVMLLPAALNYHEPRGISSQHSNRERMLLGFQLCSARILLGRPFLMKPELSWTDNNEPSFAVHMANSCIESAKTIVNFLPDEPQLDYLYNKGPWWCIVHHMMQAISILLLGLTHPTATSHDSMSLIQYTKKVLRWLQSMPDPVAQRAYRVAFDLLGTVAKQHSLKTSDTWSLGVDRIMPARQEMHHAFSDGNTSAFACEPQEQSALHSQASGLHPDVASYAAYDAWMTDTACAQYEPDSLPGPYYTS